MHTPNEKTYALDIVKNYLPAIVIIGTGVVSLILTWKKVDDNTNGLKELREQVLRQYTTQREMNDKTNREVDALQEWKAYQEGYKKGIEDSNKK